MRQQINLYQAVLIDKPEPLQARQAGMILVGFFVALLLLGGFSYWQLHDATKRMETLQQQKDILEKRVAELERRYPEQQKSIALAEEIVQTKKMLAGQKQLLGYFSDREATGNDSVLSALEGLARHRSPGVWLRRIQLASAGERISLAGSALKPEQVPQYLQSLGEKRVLGGQVFSRLTLTRLQEKPGQIDFSLESLTGEEQ